VRLCRVNLPALGEGPSTNRARSNGAGRNERAFNESLFRTSPHGCPTSINWMAGFDCHVNSRLHRKSSQELMSARQESCAFNGTFG
jgi:hypothetical protein